jgi:hypothetical protein
MYIHTKTGCNTARNGTDIDGVMLSQHIQQLLLLSGSKDFSALTGWIPTGIGQNITYIVAPLIKYMIS